MEVLKEIHDFITRPMYIDDSTIGYILTIKMVSMLLSEQSTSLKNMMALGKTCLNFASG